MGGEKEEIIENRGSPAFLCNNLSIAFYFFNIYTDFKLTLTILFQYFHNGDDTLTDKFTLVARTSTKTSVPATVNIQIIPVNDEVPRVVKNNGIEVWAGSSILLTTNDLSKFDYFLLVK